jgi:hypothetical protein
MNTEKEQNIPCINTKIENCSLICLHLCFDIDTDVCRTILKIILKYLKICL